MAARESQRAAAGRELALRSQLGVRQSEGWRGRAAVGAAESGALGLGLRSSGLFRRLIVPLLPSPLLLPGTGNGQIPALQVRAAPSSWALPLKESLEAEAGV